mmetsp:Transcript_14604/g.47708  ORF Transcript_14604/g.47708 Transcript_14604/m.47708 type:complete len:271 (-) Transcript_14604:414-1226(-)
MVRTLPSSPLERPLHKSDPRCRCGGCSFGDHPKEFNRAVDRRPNNDRTKHEHMHPNHHSLHPSLCLCSRRRPSFFYSCAPLALPFRSRCRNGGLNGSLRLGTRIRDHFPQLQFRLPADRSNRNLLLRIRLLSHSAHGIHESSAEVVVRNGGGGRRHRSKGHISARTASILHPLLRGLGSSAGGSGGRAIGERVLARSPLQGAAPATSFREQGMRRVGRDSAFGNLDGDWRHHERFVPRRRGHLVTLNLQLAVKFILGGTCVDVSRDAVRW